MGINESITRRREHLSKLRSNLSTSGLSALEKRLQAALENSASEECIQRRDNKGPVRLSFPQQRVWIVEQLQPGTAAYHVPSAFRIKGRLDLHALKYSLDELIRRHESLRTGFTQIGGEPFQVVAESVEMPLTVDDLTGVPEESKEAETRRGVKNEIHRCFDLTEAPLFRARLLKLRDEEHVLILVMHHIISDVWSMGILARELRALYNSYRRGEASPLSDLPIQYRDFALWQRENLRGEILDQQLEYWKRQLSGAPATLELPTDHPRPTSLSARGSVQIFTFPDQLCDSLRRLSLQEGTTLFMTLLAAFNLLLSRYSSQKDIVVGCDIAGRNRTELEGLIGFFVNTLAIRTDLSGDPSFRQLLGRVKEVCLGAYAHQDIPFERLVAELQPERRSNYSPIFQVMFSLQSRHQQREQQGGNWDGLSVSGFNAEGETAMFDLSFRIIEAQQSLVATLEYSADLFEPKTIKRMLRHFRVMLEAIVARPEDPVSSLPILSEAERREMLEVWNDPGRECPQEGGCIHHLFEQQAERTPDRVALIFEDERLSYGELNARANQLARHLRGLGVGPETLIGICVERSIEMVVGLLGILKAGGAYLPLDPDYPPERLAFMIEDAAVSLLLTQERLLASLPEHKAEVMCLDSDWSRISRHSTDDLMPEEGAGSITPENLAYVIYTSGSTGKPKGVMVSHSSVARLFSATEGQFHFSADDVWTLFHSYAFDFSVWEIWGALLYGGRLVVVPHLVSRSPEAFYGLLRREKVTVLNQTPTAFRQLIRAEQEIEDSKALALRLVIFGGEALEAQSLQPWFERHKDALPQLVNMYGITETTVHVTYRPLLAADARANSRSMVGRRIPDLELYVLDEQLQLVPVGVSGEVYVGGQGLARGYLHRPELTAERFVPHPFGRGGGARLYRTGDLARLHSDGDLEYIGRADQQVKVRGFRIELGEIEAALLQHSEIKEAVVIAREDSPGDKRLVAYVIPNAFELDIASVRSFLATRLPDYMMPSAFVALDSLPLNPSGKLDRKALPFPDGARAALCTAFVAPRSSLEQDLADIWTRLLGVKRVGVHDNFFELGGHSLLLTQLATRIRDRFGVEVPMRILFDAPTIEGISLSIGARLMDETDETDLALLLAEMGEMTSDETTAL